MSSNVEMIAKARAYVQPSLDRDLWNPGLQAVLDVCDALEAGAGGRSARYRVEDAYVRALLDGNVDAYVALLDAHSDLNEREA